MSQHWPADKVERRPLSSLTLYPENARTHSEAQISQIAASMQQWGWTIPILVDEAGVIIAGHGRFMAAKELGLSDVPVMTARGWTEAQKRAYRLADNQLSLNAGWDDALLGTELEALQDSGFDLDLVGFPNLDEILGLGGNGLTDPDEAPPAPQVATCAMGDVWLLGVHRLVCGDSTQSLAVQAALKGVIPHLMVTDPPYGVNYDPAWRVAVGLSAGAATGKVQNDDRADWSEAWRLFPGAVAYVWHGGLHAGTVEQSLAICGFRLRAQIVWVKTRPVLSRGHYHWQHEPVLYAVQDGQPDQWRFEPEHELAAYAVRKDKPSDWHGDRRQSTVWFIEHIKSDTGHSAQKPVECMRRPIENNSSRGQAVYDPFVGSGTTIIAAELTGRVCHAIEIDPRYCDVSIMRWQNFTGKTAIREADGRAFSSMVSTTKEVA